MGWRSWAPILLGRVAVVWAAVLTASKPALPPGSSEFSITQSWSQAADQARAVYVHVHGSGGRPVIFLHGIREKASDQEPPEALKRIDGGNNVFLYPSGYMNAWNIGPEASKAPDVAFLEAVVDKLKTYSNVDMSDGVTLVGYSNGCGMVHAVYIESSYPEFKRAACGATPLTVAQYNRGKFYKRPTPAGNSDDYIVEVSPLAGRILWSYHGFRDWLIPWAGGPSLVGSTFMSAPSSAAAWAAHFGPPRPAATASWSFGPEESYLAGQVKLFTFEEASHELPLTHMPQVDHIIRSLAELRGNASSPERPRPADVGTRAGV